MKGSVSMAIAVKERNEPIKDVLNGTYESIKTVISMGHELSKPKLLNNLLYLQFGVLIGITGDIKGKLILAGETSIFGSIGEVMFGMPLEGEMLISFSGELGNMIAGGMATNIAEQGITTDITSPTVLQGNTTLSGYDKAIHTIARFDGGGEMDIYLLLD